MLPSSHSQVKPLLGPSVSVILLSFRNQVNSYPTNSFLACNSTHIHTRAHNGTAQRGHDAGALRHGLLRSVSVGAGVNLWGVELQCSSEPWEMYAPCTPQNPARPPLLTGLRACVTRRGASAGSARGLFQAKLPDLAYDYGALQPAISGALGMGWEGGLRLRPRDARVLCAHTCGRACMRARTHTWIDSPRTATPPQPRRPDHGAAPQEAPPGVRDQLQRRDAAICRGAKTEGFPLHRPRSRGRIAQGEQARLRGPTSPQSSQGNELTHARAPPPHTGKQAESKNDIAKAIQLQAAIKFNGGGASLSARGALCWCSPVSETEHECCGLLQCASLVRRSRPPARPGSRLPPHITPRAQQVL